MKVILSTALLVCTFLPHPTDPFFAMFMFAFLTPDRPFACVLAQTSVIIPQVLPHLVLAYTTPPSFVPTFSGELRGFNAVEFHRRLSGISLQISCYIVRSPPTMHPHVLTHTLSPHTLSSSRTYRLPFSQTLSRSPTPVLPHTAGMSVFAL